MGPSGSGKSTLLNIVGLLDRASAGRYALDGRDVTDSYHLVSRLDAVGNVELPMVFAGVPKRERRERAEAALERVGLGDRMHHKPTEMSGGQAQRVAVARSTIMGPSVLLADEPTGNLDSVSGNRVLDLLEGLHKDGLTLIVVTHDPAVARLADRVIVLKDGQLAREWKGSEVVSLDQLFEGDVR
ncbi:UNVERIFIED_CONTAM: hypothetical protein GTU68_016335 [Idotea baltica]|nr:hypothetical protein [Idotea baltica]